MQIKRKQQPALRTIVTAAKQAKRHSANGHLQVLEQIDLSLLTMPSAVRAQCLRQPCQIVNTTHSAVWYNTYRIV
jgi:hypothetical protein